jgi:hypothetical protein
LNCGLNKRTSTGAFWRLRGIRHEMAISADRMAAGRSFSVAPRRAEAAIAVHERGGIVLAEEQRAAVAHFTGSERIA